MCANGEDENCPIRRTADMNEIRPLRPNDALDDLIALSRAFFAEYESHHPDFFAIDALQDNDIAGYFNRWLDDAAGKTFVAVSDVHIVGYITVYVQEQPSYWQVKRIGHISGLMVAPAYRRQGIAARLLDEARSFFRQMGVVYFTVYTAVANQPALQFYEQSDMVPLYTTLLGDTLTGA
jgi:ribosomal protein S18 acetylase RimI-like enzyme